MTCAVAIGLGLLIGLVLGALGALGGGGAILTLPALVYVLTQPPSEATTGSLVIVGLASAVAVVGRARAGEVRWRSGVAFGLVGIVGTIVGAAVNRRLDNRWLLLGFALVIVVAAIAMLTSNGSTANSATTSGPPVRDGRGRASQVAMITGVVGLAVGFLTGLFGVGGGFVIVPALTLVLGMPMAAATGTSLLVITMNSASSLGARIGDLRVDWAVIVPLTLAAVAGTTIGRRIAGRIPGRALQRAFAILLLAVAGALLVENAMVGQ